jgi:hypothetical protein
VCEHLARAGATPATPHLLDRRALTAVLALPDLRPDAIVASPTCVGALVDRFARPARSAGPCEPSWGAVYDNSEPAGIGNVWPQAFTGG